MTTSTTPSNRTNANSTVMLAGVTELGVRADMPRGVVDLTLTAAGLVLVSADDGPANIPTLVTWSHLEGFSADRSVVLADGRVGQVLAIVAHGPAFEDDACARRFVVPAPELVQFFGTLATHSEAWAAGRAEPRGAVARARVGTVCALVAGVVATLLSSIAGAWSNWGAVPRHGQGYRRLGPITGGLLAVALVAGSTSTTLATSAPSDFPGTHTVAAAALLPHYGNLAEAIAAPPTAKLAPATAPPAPAPPALAASAPLQSHEMFGYAPYWTLPESSGFNVQDLTTLAYFSVDANGNGTLNQSGPGWNGYESQDLANLVTRSHAAGDRVVLTVTCFSQASLNQITSDPTAPATLSASLIAALGAKNLDGVNFDFEGQGSSDQVGLTSLITQVSNALHAANPHWQVTMATYASAAGDPNGFYNVAALAPALDGFFVMAYDMNDPVTPSPTAPLVGGGYSDTEALQQYTAVMPASKVILGVPYYGYDWPTSDGGSTAQSTGPEAPLSYGTIASSGEPTYWDPATQTAWTSYQVGGQWHETYFDNPTSLALKAELANSFHIRGMGIWALGMDGNDPAMLAALLGNAPPVKDFSPGPTATAPSASTTTTTLAGAGYTTTGVWANGAVNLTPIAAVGGGTLVGTLASFTTSDALLSCLSSGPLLNVWTVPTLPGVYVATAEQPGNCATGMWSFPIPPAVAPPLTGSGSGSTTATSSPPTTTTTTSSPPASSTTTTVPSSATPIPVGGIKIGTPALSGSSESSTTTTSSVSTTTTSSAPSISTTTTSTLAAHARSGFGR